MYTEGALPKAAATSRRYKTTLSDPDSGVLDYGRGFSAFDMWTARATQREKMMGADVKAAGTFLRRLDLSLRMADALNIAIAQRIHAALGIHVVAA